MSGVGSGRSSGLAWRSLLWTILLPGVVTVYVPWNFFGLGRTPVALVTFISILGLLAIALGAALLVMCIVEFARSGKGTLSPVDPPRLLVVQGLYRYVRNPMYLSVTMILLGEALLMRSAPLAVYWAIWFLCVNAFVMGYEEPTLRRQFGESYENYARQVGRWIPRLRMPKSIAFSILLLVCGALAFAQTRVLNLRGDRFKPLTEDQLTPEQRTMVNDLLAGSRGSMNGPFNVLLRSPVMGNHAQQLGEYVRFRTSVPRRLNEMAILLTAKWWSSQYEWHAHKPLALDAGLSAAIVDDIQAGRRPAAMQPDERAVYDFSTELRERRRVSDATYKAALDVLGEKGVVDLMALMGYYDLVSMVLNVDRYPLPAGAPLPFPEPR